MRFQADCLSRCELPSEQRAVVLVEQAIVCSDPLHDDLLEPCNCMVAPVGVPLRMSPDFDPHSFFNELVVGDLTPPAKLVLRIVPLNI